MSGVALSRAAEADLRHIWLYSAETWGVAQAERYTEAIRHVCVELSAERFVPRQVEAREGYWSYAVSQHTIYFQRSEAGIFVMRVLHQRMDVDQHLF